jgi:hypothetical protein
MSYWIYENWQAGPRKAVIHAGQCKFCNDGHGLKGGSDPRHGTWHGPFSSLDDARALSRSLSVRDRRECSFCL